MTRCGGSFRLLCLWRAFVLRCGAWSWCARNQLAAPLRCTVCPAVPSVLRVAIGEVTGLYTVNLLGRLPVSIAPSFPFPRPCASSIKAVKCCSPVQDLTFQARGTTCESLTYPTSRICGGINLCLRTHRGSDLWIYAARIHLVTLRFCIAFARRT